MNHIEQSYYFHSKKFLLTPTPLELPVGLSWVMAAFFGRDLIVFATYSLSRDLDIVITTLLSHELNCYHGFFLGRDLDHYCHCFGWS